MFHEFGLTDRIDHRPADGHHRSCSVEVCSTTQGGAVWLSIQLAIAIAVLIGVLTLAILYLTRLNKVIYHREREKSQAMERMKTVIGTSLDGVVVCSKAIWTL